MLLDPVQRSVFYKRFVGLIPRFLLLINMCHLGTWHWWAVGRRTLQARVGPTRRLRPTTTISSLRGREGIVGRPTLFCMMMGWCRVDNSPL